MLKNASCSRPLLVVVRLCTVMVYLSNKVMCTALFCYSFVTSYKNFKVILWKNFHFPKFLRRFRKNRVMRYRILFLAHDSKKIPENLSLSRNLENWVELSLSLNKSQILCIVHQYFSHSFA